MRGTQVDYPRASSVARLVTDAPTAYVLVSNTLGGLHAQLPPGLLRTERQPPEPREVVEIWLSA